MSARPTKLEQGTYWRDPLSGRYWCVNRLEEGDRAHIWSEHRFAEDLPEDRVFTRWAVGGGTRTMFMRQSVMLSEWIWLGETQIAQIDHDSAAAAVGYVAKTYYDAATHAVGKPDAVREGQRWRWRWQDNNNPYVVKCVHRHERDHTFVEFTDCLEVFVGDLLNDSRWVYEGERGEPMKKPLPQPGDRYTEKHWMAGVPAVERVVKHVGVDDVEFLNGSRVAINALCDDDDFYERVESP